MKLLVDGSIFAWQVRGGISSLYRALLPAVQALDPGIQIRLALQGRELPAGMEPLKPFCEYVPSLPPSLRPWRVWRHVRTPFNAIARQLSFQSSHAEVFHPTFYTCPATRTPCFCLAYDMIAERFPESYTPALVQTWRQMKRRTFERASVILCISESARRDVMNLYAVDGRKCRVVYLGPSVDHVTASTEQDGEPTTPYFLFVGDYQMGYKNFGFLLTCLAAGRAKGVRDVVLRVVSHKVPTQDQWRQYNAVIGEGRLVFDSDCDDHTLARHYRQCTAVLYPSLYEGFGLPVLDALQAGAPVVCSNASSLPEVGGGAAYYFDPRSEMSFAEALEKALADGRDARYVAARQAQAARFTWRKTAEQFIDACRTVAGSGR